MSDLWLLLWKLSAGHEALTQKLQRYVR